ncbi:hypothetical protein KIPB_003740 [Kipferlia bialata]|uniref:Calcineurin-like phosphoesterase domain-containing protein n=1 Tax=Kipferlia bialata TaxID=797122 RepID=A0A9K3CSR6_9EUKA|nr:hypothetical protein KIPB_003740 [Kipferlia bialata]|eukprot:g3740.t1
MAYIPTPGDLSECGYSSQGQQGVDALVHVREWLERVATHSHCAYAVVAGNHDVGNFVGCPYPVSAEGVERWRGVYGSGVVTHKNEGREKGQAGATDSGADTDAAHTDTPAPSPLGGWVYDIPPRGHASDTESDTVCGQVAWRLIGLNSMVYGHPEMGQSQQQWLDGVLATTPADTPLVLFQHTPFSLDRPGDTDPSVAVPYSALYWTGAAGDRCRALTSLTRHRVRLVATGHTHQGRTSSIPCVSTDASTPCLPCVWCPPMCGLGVESDSLPGWDSDTTGYLRHTLSLSPPTVANANGPNEAQDTVRTDTVWVQPISRTLTFNPKQET